jgi:putative membrane protein insertion efficiency factor
MFMAVDAAAPRNTQHSGAIVIRTICVVAIQGYRLLISPWLGPACRFEPTCSAYACEAIDRFGVLKGGGLAAWRLLKCHPFHPGGYDPLKGEPKVQGARDS